MRAQLQRGTLSGGQGQEKKFTLDQVMSAPFPSELVAAPTGTHQLGAECQGVRNIWVAEPPGYKGRQITSYTEDDGIEIGELTWTPDGQSIVFTRGGDLEGLKKTQTRAVNRKSRNRIWIVSLDGKLRQLAEGHSAVVNPKGDRLAFILKRDVWSVSSRVAKRPHNCSRQKGAAAPSTGRRTDQRFRLSAIMAITASSAFTRRQVKEFGISIPALTATWSLSGHAMAGRSPLFAFLPHE